MRDALRIGQRRLLLSAMNELNVSLQHSILTLSAQGWSNRRIARELGLHRETVGRHLRLAASKPAKVCRDLWMIGCEALMGIGRLSEDGRAYSMRYAARLN